MMLNLEDEIFVILKETVHMNYILWVYVYPLLQDSPGKVHRPR